jgi:dihydroorotate dehydrogenase
MAEHNDGLGGRTMLTDLGGGALRLLPPETAHRAALWLVRAAAPFLSAVPADDPRLAIEVFGRKFPNPVGLAAGFDKDAEVPEAMLKFGFGFVECGTVTPKPQPGNPRPRLFRLTRDRAVINRMGLNNCGMENAAQRLEGRKRNGIAGINIGANKDSVDRIEDFRRGFGRLAPLADYVTVNVSSPNTPGLRALQEKDALQRLLGALAEERARIGTGTPLLLKIAPDLDAPALDDIAEAALAFGLQGIIATNTTTARPPTLTSKDARETGGLSGAPLFAPSIEILRQLRARVGSKLVLLGVGGIASGADAYAKIRAGASLVQLYTALVFEGPGLIGRIKRDLAALLARDGFTSLSQAVGADVI